MSGQGDQGLSIQDLERELVDLARRREELLKERALFKRLGFSAERVNLALRLNEQRRGKVASLLARLNGQTQEQKGKVGGAQAHSPRLP